MSGLATSISSRRNFATKLAFTTVERALERPYQGLSIALRIRLTSVFEKNLSGVEEPSYYSKNRRNLASTEPWSLMGVFEWS